MSSPGTVVVRPAVGSIARLSDWVELTKPRISALVLVTVAVSGFVARWGQPEPLSILHALIGVALIAASASALNQWLEVDTDQLMPRTANRPLPAGRMGTGQVCVFAALTGVLGTAYLCLLVNATTAAWGIVTWFLYAWVYTPLKRRTSLNTVVGAISGATPVLMGWTAAGGELDMRAAAIFLVVFLWQFPHFMAIAWLYRHQYESAGIRMLTVTDPTGRRAGLQSVVAALALLPVSFVPALFVAAPGASLYVALAFVLGVGQLICAFLFFAVRSQTTARWLLRASLIYLPALLVLLIFLPLF